jgi:hypothetical protein
MSFLCPRCGRISFHPEDERQGYCGHCHDYTALKAGDVLRIRRAGSKDEWCMCRVELASTNGQSLALRVVEGILRPQQGGIIAGAIAITIDPVRRIPTEIFSNTDLEIEGRANERGSEAGAANN